MRWRKTLCGTASIFVGVGLLLTANRATAGDRYHAPSRGYGSVATSAPAPAPPRAPAPFVPRPAQPAGVTIVYDIPAAPPPSATAPSMYVDIREPGGAVRTLPLEGGPEAIQTRDVIVRPGESVRIHLVLAPRK
jgi:hypothetical protein